MMKERTVVERVTIRFAGDSGDGMQLAGNQLTNTSAMYGADVATFPDFPAEIRAPAGTLAGVSSYQIHIDSDRSRTPGDLLDVLVVMNPAALKANLKDVKDGGFIIVDSDTFVHKNLRMAGYDDDPLNDGTLSGYRLVSIPLSSLNRDAVTESGVQKNLIPRSKNVYALGIVYWLYDQSLDSTRKWIRSTFSKRPEVVDANIRALEAGHAFAETIELFTEHYSIPRANLPAGEYRKITGNEALSLGLLAAAHLGGQDLCYFTYPITPATEVLHVVSKHKEYGVKTFQAEDEIAAITATVGAAYGGAFAATATSGPGLALMGEGINLGVMAELPMVIANVQRAGPSTGMPTKNEQADLLQSMFGRNGESPLPVLAAATPSDCFDLAIEAFRLAVKHMTPVILLSDGYLGNGSESWLIPDISDYPAIDPNYRTDPEGFEPFLRDPSTMARPWAIPGTPGLEHRLGGLEKEQGSGNVSYVALNHEVMTLERAAKLDRIADDLPAPELVGDDSGDLLLLGWGSSYGAITTAVHHARSRGKKVSGMHLRYINPLPRDLGERMKRFTHVLIPEMNMGQLLLLIRGKYLVDAIGMHKVQGKPFMIQEIEERIDSILSGGA